MSSIRYRIVNKYSRLLFFVVFIIIFIVFLVIGSYLNERTEIQVSELFASERVLQTVAVRNSIRENLKRIVNESSILANYSFPEFEQDLRTSESMANLLEIELDSYQDSASYSYFDFSDEKNISASDPGETGAIALEFAQKWRNVYLEELSSTRESMIVPPLVISRNSVFLGLIFPVTVDSEPRGMFITVINLTEPFERYIRLIADDISGKLIVIDDSLRLLWDERKEIEDRSFFNLLGDAPEINTDNLQNEIGKNDSGSYRIEFDSSFLKRQSTNISWSSLIIEKQRMIIVLLSEEQELLNILQNQNQSGLILYLSIALFFLVVYFGGLRIKYLTMKQMFLEENRKKLTEVVNEKTAKLKTMLNRYTALYEFANDAIYLLKDGVFIECNKKTLELFDADALEDLIGKTPADLSPEYQEDGQRSDDKAQILLSESLNGRPQRFDWKHETLKGHIFYVEISLKTIDMNGEYITQAITRDVSERINNLREKDVMMKEIHHRVKNNLQIINSFLNLQKDGLQNSEAYKSIFNTQRRVDVMAKMHELLYSYDSLADISSTDYFREIVSFFSHQDGDLSSVNILYDFEDILLDPDRSMYVGFILSELIDNAVKHGSNPNKIYVEISLKKEERAAVLEVSDRGTGFIPKDGHDYSGIGIQLVSGLASQLNGKVSWFEEKGTKVIFRFPLNV